MNPVKRILLPMLCLAVLLFSSIALAADSAEDQNAAALKKMTEKEKKQYDLALEKALVHYEKAELLYEKEKLAEVAVELEAIIALEYPASATGTDGANLQLDMHSWLGEIYLELGKPDKGIETVLAGIAKAPEVSTYSYQLYMTLGHIYKVTKKTDKALEAFETAEEINKVLMEAEEGAAEN